MTRNKTAVLLLAAALAVSSGCGRTNPLTAKRIKSVEKGLMRAVYL
ncbi:MAG: hypothetical protein GYA74_08090, partial [Acidobacteria bacterium]|nr:hypothetical protein [Acidobacteriota bacterium]